MKNVRKSINIGLLIGFILLAGFSFYKFFPQIWGDVVYPLEYKDEIASASNEFHVEKNLIAAVIFVESHFNPQAGSGAGARGLMQLVPSTARGVARNIGMTDYNDSKIYDPATNIRLGTAYLRSAIDSRGGNLDVALANYNGGPAVAGRFQVALDRSVLPRETDGYIRKVRTAWEAYDEIYGADWSGPDGPYTAPNPDDSNVSSRQPGQAVKPSGPSFPTFSLQPQKSFVDQLDIKNIFSNLFGK